MQDSRALIIASSLLAISLIAGACGGSSAETTTMADTSDVVFGRGSVPDTVPDSFPIPGEAVVGATLVDSNRGLTEMILTFPANVAAVVSYYEENIPGRGYEIASSAGSETEWQIQFDGVDLHGVITVRTGGSGVASAVVEFSRM